MIRFGLIGHGRFGKHYERLLGELPDVKLIDIATRHTTTTIDNLMRDVDAVIIATPASTHHDLAKRALEAGKHVLVEKPMVTSVAEARSLRDAVTASGKTLMVGFQYLYNDGIADLKGKLSSLGDIHYYLGEHLSGGPQRTDIGVFLDAGVHDLSIIEYYFHPGNIVSAVGKKLNDFLAVTATYESGLVAHLITSWNYPEKVRRIGIVGNNGGITYDEFSVQHRTEPLRSELEHFIDCIRLNKQPTSDVHFGLKIAQDAESILHSLQS